MKPLPWTRMTSVLPLLAALVSGCDPVHMINLVNETADTLSVTARRTIHFRTDDVHTTDLHGNYDDMWISFTVLPKTTVGCGTTIAGIEDEMPFKELTIVNNASHDSIIAHSESEVLDLFDRGTFGGLEIPFTIRVKE